MNHIKFNFIYFVNRLSPLPALVILAGLFLYQPVYAGYPQLSDYYDWGPYYGSALPAATGTGRVLQATTTAAELADDQMISGWVEAYPNPDVPDAMQYFIGVEGQGLVEIGPDQIPDGLDINQLVGQYTALGTVDGERIFAPVPPPTDANLAEKAATVSNEQRPPDLPSAGTTTGFFHRLEMFGETVVDSSLNLITPGRAPERAFRRLSERTAEASELITDQNPAADQAARQVADAMQNLFERTDDEATIRRFEERVAGLQVAVEAGSASVPEGAADDFTDLRHAMADGVDIAADKLDKPAVTTGVVQGLQSLKSIGVLQRDQADHIYELDSRQAVRNAFEEFAANGYITPADVKSALDETAATLYPQQTRTFIEMDKLESISRYEAVRPDDATLAKLESFSTSFVPGVTTVPPDLLPYWVATVNLDRMQQTMRPDFIPTETLNMMEQRRPNTFAKYKELEYRFKPSPDDIAALEQYKTQLRDQFKDNPEALNNITKYLPPQLQRIDGFHERFGLKDPEGWQRPAGLAQLPFAGPGGLRDVNAIDKYCAANNCNNYAPPSGFTFKPTVNVNFKPDESGRPPIFPGMTAFRPPVAMYDIVPQTPTRYVGHNGCTNPVDCLKAFRDIPPDERANNFFVFQAPPNGLVVERRFDPANMTAEQKKEYEAAMQRGEINSDGTPKLFPGNTGSMNPQGQPIAGPGAMYNPDGTFNANFRASAYQPNQNYMGQQQPGGYMSGPAYRPDGAMDPNYRPISPTGGAYNPGMYSSAPGQNSSGPFYPGYAQPANNFQAPPPGGGNYYTPPTNNNNAPGGAMYAPPPAAGNFNPPPPSDGGGNQAPPPSEGGGNQAPPPGDGGGNDYAPPSSDGGGGGEAPPSGGGGGEAPPSGDGGGGAPPPG